MEDKFSLWFIEIKVSTIFKLKTTQLLNYFTKNYFTTLLLY